MLRDPSKPTREWQYGGLAVAVVLATIFQAVLVARSPIIARDGMLFVQIAQQLDNASAMFRSQAQHPGYPALIGTAHQITGAPDTLEAWILAARMASGVCGILCVVAMWFLTRRLFGTPIANVAAVLTAGLPLLRQNAADALSDSPHLLFYTLAVWMICEGQARGHIKWFAAAGVVSGLAFWIRPEGWSVAIVASAILLVSLLRATASLRPRIAFQWASLVMATLLVSTPYLLIAGKVTSKLTEKENLIALRSAPVQPSKPLHTAVAPLQDSQEKATLPATSPRRSTLGMIGRAGRTAFFAFAELATEAVQRLHVLLAFVGCAIVARGRSLLADRGVRFLLVLALFHASLLILLFFLGGYIDQRHLMPLTVVVIPLAAVGLHEVAHRLAQRWQDRHGPNHRFVGRPAVWTACVAGLVVLGMMPRCLRPLHREFHPHYEAGVWLRSQLQPGDRILTNSSYIAFYAEKRSTWIAEKDLAQPPVRSALLAPGRTFVVIDAYVPASVDPQWLAPDGVDAAEQKIFFRVVGDHRRDVYLTTLKLTSGRRVASRSL